MVEYIMMRRKEREVTDLDSIEEILLKCRTCHLAMADGGAPYVVPLSFGYRFTEKDELELFFHSAHEGKKLDILRKNSRVCFEISDEGVLENAQSPCDMGYFYSSVIGFGEVVFLKEAADKCTGLAAIVKRQTGRDMLFTDKQTEAVCVYKVVSADFSGKQKKGEGDQNEQTL